MAKQKPQSQGSFSFFDEVEKAEPAPKPGRHTLKPPVQVEVIEEKEVAPHMIEIEKPLETTTGQKMAEQQEAQPTSIAEGENVLLKPKEIVIINEEQSPIETNFTHEEVFVTEQISEKNLVEETAPQQEVIEKKQSSRGRRSSKEHSLAADLVEIPDDEELFQKHYYSMGEVTTMFNESHSLIRYWESEFDILKPKKNGKGDRFFRPADVKNLYLIYDLLRRRKFTIEGAREYLKNNEKVDEKFAAIQSLQKIRTFFLELKANL